MPNFPRTDCHIEIDGREYLLTASHRGVIDRQ
jgi:hypothetical protein